MNGRQQQAIAAELMEGTVEPCSAAHNCVFDRDGCYPWARPDRTDRRRCRAAGAGQVIAFEISAPRRKASRQMGADRVYDPLEVDPYDAKIIVKV